MGSYSQRDFHEDWQAALNDRRQVFVIADTVCAFIAGAGVAALVIFGLVM